MGAAVMVWPVLPLLATGVGALSWLLARVAPRLEFKCLDSFLLGRSRSLEIGLREAANLLVYKCTSHITMSFFTM